MSVITKEKQYWEEYFPLGLIMSTCVIINKDKMLES